MDVSGEKDTDAHFTLAQETREEQREVDLYSLWCAQLRL